MVASTAPATSAASRAEVAPENKSSTSFSGSKPLALAIAIHHKLVMSPTPPVMTRLPLSSFTDLMPLAPIRLWVPTARLLRNTLTLAPLSMARSGVHHRRTALRVDACGDLLHRARTGPRIDEVEVETFVFEIALLVGDDGRPDR